MRHSDVPLPQPPGGDRPSENWVCGNAKYGTPCPCGPLPNGKCPAQGLCRPTAETSGSTQLYQCARPKCLGGACDMGPEPDGQCGMIPKPCVPVRSSLGRRRILLNLAITTSIGVLLLAFGGSWRWEIFAPGDLVEPHALLLGGEQRNDRCAACHPVARGRFAEWFGTGQAGHANVTQSDLCMDCHHAKLDSALATRPHNLSLGELQQVTNSLQSSPWSAGSISLGKTRAATEVQCAVCHREHHGRDADLTSLSNAQCQTCHSIQFRSFAVGHPQWTSWPYGRGGSIAFDHSSHEHDHFTKAGQTFDCRSCHQVDVRGEIARAGSFETMCATCHLKPLELDVREGFSLVRLPTLDDASIEDANMDLGPWPETSKGVDLIQLPEFTRALLCVDESVEQAVVQLTDPASTNLQEPLSAAGIKASVTLAEGIRGLLDRLTTDPGKELQRRLGIAEASRALGQLSPQLIAGAKNVWFGDESIKVADDPQNMLPNGGWYRDDLRAAIHYRGTGHADPLIQFLAELSNDRRLTDEQRTQIASIAAVKSCLECHPDPKMHEGNSWRSVRNDVGKRLFTKFSHRPHMNLPELSDCRYCHQVRQVGMRDQALVHVASYRAIKQPSGSNRLPESSGISTEVISDFQQLLKTACMDCHVPKAAGDNCTKCHNYHVDSWE